MSLWCPLENSSQWNVCGREEKNGWVLYKTCIVTTPKKAQASYTISVTLWADEKQFKSFENLHIDTFKSLSLVTFNIQFHWCWI